jgi:anhydro-N-acetylmuramic acid kinase
VSARRGPGLFVGLMSGTSLDGVDCVLADFSGPPRLLATRFLPYPADVKMELLGLSASGSDELERAGRASVAISDIYATAIRDLLAEAGVAVAEVAAIGCHGQTVRHRPEQGFTIQLANPALLAERAGIAVVADFRSRDIAAGGQGAPLVPAFHAACFRSAARHRVVINIGGIANITDLPVHGPVRGFDTGPGNLLLDLWAARHTAADFDRDGQFAARGTIIPALLERLLAEDYLRRPPPKSTGRERFNDRWLAANGVADQPAHDVQATLAEFTARTIVQSVEAHCPGAEEAYACGGGVHNLDLMQRLQGLLGARPLATTDALGIPADWVEAMAFAWLARQSLEHLPGNLPEVTGARGPRILGAIYPA